MKCFKNDIFLYTIVAFLGLLVVILVAVAFLFASNRKNSTPKIEIKEKECKDSSCKTSLVQVNNVLKAEVTPSPKIIYTCTTFFDRPNKWKAFKKGMNSLVELHPTILKDVSMWYVVNEPSKTDWAYKIAHRFPWVTFIQKEESMRGQANSLNMIREQIRFFDYWLQWEESWFATRPFLQDALDILTQNKLTQLQLTITPPHKEPNWFKLCKPVNDVWAAVPFSRAMYDHVMTTKSGYELGGTMDWPLFSLCPSLNDVRFNIDLPPFNTDPNLWPWKFEWEYAKNWALAGGLKGIFLKAPVTRDPAHKSTY